jgi:hypothetical protein
MTCPFCDSPDVELVAPWGGQIITSQMRCRSCNTYFEAIRDEFDGGESGSTPQVPRDPIGRIPFREFGSITSPASDEPQPNSPWTTSSEDDR